MILYIRELQNSTRKPLEINKFNNEAEDKIKLYESVAFLYTNNISTETEVTDTQPSTKA